MKTNPEIINNLTDKQLYEIYGEVKDYLIAGESIFNTSYPNSIFKEVFSITNYLQAYKLYEDLQQSIIKRWTTLTYKSL